MSCVIIMMISMIVLLCSIRHDVILFQTAFIHIYIYIYIHVYMYINECLKVEALGGHGRYYHRHACYYVHRERYH